MTSVPQSYEKDINNYALIERADDVIAIDFIDQIFETFSVTYVGSEFLFLNTEEAMNFTVQAVNEIPNRGSELLCSISEMEKLPPANTLPPSLAALSIRFNTKILGKPLNECYWPALKRICQRRGIDLTGVNDVFVIVMSLNNDGMQVRALLKYIFHEVIHCAMQKEGNNSDKINFTKDEELVNSIVEELAQILFMKALI